MIAEPPSPCIRTCTIDPVSTLCHGCARTIDEIIAWTSASVAEKHAILGAVNQRLQSVSVISK